jgi:subtilisin family serine protease
MATLTATPAVAEGEILGAASANAVKDSYIVEFNDGAVRSQSVQSLAGSLASKHHATVKATYQHAVHGFAASMSEADARKLAADPAVLRVQQDAVVSVKSAQFNPPSWGLDRIDQRNQPMFNSYTYPNVASNVRAYVIDTGIRTTHQDFGGRATWGANFVDGNNSDCDGHGTHVAGTIGGSLVGVAKGVSLTAVKVLDCLGSGLVSGIVSGVDWVTNDHVSGPAVANLSLGVQGSEPTLENAIRNSIADGITYTIASGNSNTSACDFSPARVGEAITVNATDRSDARASFSNFGPCSDIFAPGTDILSTWNNADNGAATDSGTSMSAPHVAGAAALVLSANPTLTPQQVADSLYNSSAPGMVQNAGSGTPNRMLFVASPAPPAPPTGPDRLIRGQTLHAGDSLRPGNGQYTLDMQPDGNFVLYNLSRQPLWHTHTDKNPGSYVTFQPDGNVVLYRSDNVPLWYLNTHGTASAVFVVQNDSNIVLYGPSGEVYWHRWQ